jgi:hypothetical protein
MDPNIGLTPAPSGSTVLPVVGPVPGLNTNTPAGLHSNPPQQKYCNIITPPNPCALGQQVTTLLS